MYIVVQWHLLFFQLHVVSRSTAEQAKEIWKPSVKTLFPLKPFYLPLSAEFCRHCVLSDETKAWKIIKINISFPRVGTEPTTVEFTRVQHACDPQARWPIHEIVGGSYHLSSGDLYAHLPSLFPEKKILSVILYIYTKTLKCLSVSYTLYCLTYSYINNNSR